MLSSNKVEMQPQQNCLYNLLRVRVNIVATIIIIVDTTTNSQLLVGWFSSLGIFILTTKRIFLRQITHLFENLLANYYSLDEESCARSWFVSVRCGKWEWQGIQWNIAAAANGFKIIKMIIMPLLMHAHWMKEVHKSYITWELVLVSC